MRSVRSILLGAVAALALVSVLAAQAPPRDPLNPAPNRAADEGAGPFKTLVIRGATVIDGTGGPPHGPMDQIHESLLALACCLIASGGFRSRSDSSLGPFRYRRRFNTDPLTPVGI